MISIQDIDLVGPTTGELVTVMEAIAAEIGDRGAEPCDHGETEAVDIIFRDHTIPVQRCVHCLRHQWRVEPFWLDTDEFRTWSEIGCDHAMTSEFTWVHDNGYGKQSYIIGECCDVCGMRRSWHGHGAWTVHNAEMMGDDLW